MKTTTSVPTPLQTPKLVQRGQILPIRKINAYLADTNIYVSFFDEGCNFGWEEPDWKLLAHPESVLIICVDVDTNHFMNWAQWCPYPFPRKGTNHATTSLLPWIDGMQQWVVGTVHLLYNPYINNISACYCMLNDRTALSPLGLLDPEHRFTKMVIRRANKCLQNFLSTK